MANPNISKIIGVKVAVGQAGDTVKVRNLTRGGKLSGVLNSAKEVILNSAPGSAWQQGDDIIIEMSGRVAGASKQKLNFAGGGQNVNLVVAADTSTSGVSLWKNHS